MSDKKPQLAAVSTDLKSTPVSAPDFSGCWVNQMGSTMELTISGGYVSGKYSSVSRSGGGEVTGPLKGRIDGDQISILALWPKGCMTAWIGQLVTDETAPQIKPVWYFVTETSNAEDPRFLCMSIFTVDDEFKR